MNISEYKVIPAKNSNSIKGFIKSFPQELIGVVSVKEYTEAIEIINDNSIRNYVSFIFIGVGSFVFFGLVALVIFIIELVRFNLFKSKVREDLEPVLHNINLSMAEKNVRFKTRVSAMGNLSLSIYYPEQPLRHIPNAQITLEGLYDVLLLEPCFQPKPTIVNPRTHVLLGIHAAAANRKNVLIPKVDTGFIFRGIKGWDKYYLNELYNYLSVKEFNDMIDEYNTLEKMATFNGSSSVFLVVSLFLMLVGIGFLLIIPAIIWNVREIKKYNAILVPERKRLHKKYNGLYGYRGLVITDNHPNIVSSRVDLNIIIPRDVGNAPVLTNVLSHNTPNGVHTETLMLALTIPGGIAPLFTQMLSPQQIAQQQQQQQQVQLGSETPQSDNSIQLIDV